MGCHAMTLIAILIANDAHVAGYLFLNDDVISLFVVFAINQIMGADRIVSHTRRPSNDPGQLQLVVQFDTRQDIQIEIILG